MEKEAILKRKLDLLEREGSQNRKKIRELAREVKRVHSGKVSAATTGFTVGDADTIRNVSRSVSEPKPVFGLFISVASPNNHVHYCWRDAHYRQTLWDSALGLLSVDDKIWSITP